MDSSVYVDHFYTKVAQDMGLDRETVKKIYSKYLIRASKALVTDGSLYMRGFGTLTINVNLGLQSMYFLLDAANKRYEEVQEEDLTRMRKIGLVWAKINHVMKKKTYAKEILEESIRKFRSNLGRFEKYFDSEGNYRGDSFEQNEDLQQLLIQEE